MSLQNAIEKGLPTNVDAERFVLGSILLDDSFYVQAAGTLEADDFSLEKHRRIFRRMGELQDRGERIDRVTVANELMRFNELESCDGLSYLVSLDDGLPQIPNLDSYIRIVKDKAVLRRIIFASQNMMNRCLLGEEEPGEILAGAEETLLKLGEARVKSRPASTPARSSRTTRAASTPSSIRASASRVSAPGFAKLDEMTGGLHGGDSVILAARPSMGKTALALNIAQHVALQDEADGGGLLARNVEGVAADPYAVRRRPRGQPAIPRRLSDAGRARKAESGAARAGGSAALHRRHRRRPPDGHARQAAAPAGGAAASSAW